MQTMSRMMNEDNMDDSDDHDKEEDGLISWQNSINCLRWLWFRHFVWWRAQTPYISFRRVLRVTCGSGIWKFLQFCSKASQLGPQLVMQSQVAVQAPSHCCLKASHWAWAPGTILQNVCWKRQLFVSSAMENEFYTLLNYERSNKRILYISSELHQYFCWCCYCYC